jgi:hypothetical protein
MASRAIVIVVPGLLLLSLTGDRVRSVNESSRFAAVESLVHRGTFQIDESPFRGTLDKVFVDGHFYSDKQPFFLGLLSGVYFVLHHVAGVDLARGEVYWLCLLVMGGLWLIGVACLYGALGLTGLSEAWRTFAALSLAVGSSWLTWSTVVNNHAAAASLLMIGFWFHLQRRRLPSGFFFAVAGMTDLPTTLFLLGFGVLQIVPRPDYRGLAMFVLGATPPIVVALAMNWQIAGDLVPINLHAEFFRYPGSVFDETNLSGFLRHDTESFFVYAFHMLVGRFGLVPYNPLLLVALPGLFWQVRRKGPFRNEATVVVICSSVLVLYYLLATNNYSGWSYGVRWFVPIVPLLSFFAYPIFVRPSPAKGILYGVVLAVAVAVMLLGAFNPWSYLSADRHPMRANLKTWMGR